jgi:hypothetical protein
MLRVIRDYQAKETLRAESERRENSKRSEST